MIRVYSCDLNNITNLFLFIVELYVAQNKLRKIEGLEGLSKLRILDLGANRIRVRESFIPKLCYVMPCYVMLHYAMLCYVL